MMYWYGNGMGGWGFVLMTVAVLVFWSLLIGAIVAPVRCFGPAGRAGRVSEPTPSGPERILAERYARGEIDEQEYRHRMAAVGRGGTQA